MAMLYFPKMEHIEKRTGPKMGPWGTPQPSAADDEYLPRWVLKVLSDD